jgi:hypothetical protein
MAAAQGARLGRRLLRQRQWRRPPALAALGNLKDRPFALSLPASTGSGRRESGGRCARPDNPDDAKREWELGSVVKDLGSPSPSLSWHMDGQSEGNADDEDDAPACMR